MQSLGGRWAHAPHLLKQIFIIDDDDDNDDNGDDDGGDDDGDDDLVQCDLEEGGGFMHHTCYNEEDLEPYNCKRSKFEISVSLR